MVALTRGVITVNHAHCAGCRTCEVVCSLFKSGVCAPELSAIRVRADFLDIDLTPSPCYQCADPLCMEACPVDAIFVDEVTGARVIEEDLCTGCCECIEACGDYFDPPRIQFDKDRQIVFKCDLCGGEPQCVRFCPIGAITFVTDSRGIQSGYPGED